MRLGPRFWPRGRSSWRGVEVGAGYGHDLVGFMNAVVEVVTVVSRKIEIKEGLCLCICMWTCMKENKNIKERKFSYKTRQPWIRAGISRPQTAMAGVTLWPVPYRYETVVFMQ